MNNVSVLSPTLPEQFDEASLALASARAQVDDLVRLAASTRAALDAASAGDVTARPAVIGGAARTIPRWHFAMLNDHERNDAFAVALERRITPGAEVLDIGSGTGLLAMLAATAGAGHVTTCEANPVLAEVTRQVVHAHGLSDRITVVPKMSTDLVVGEDLPRPADLVVSEIVDCALIGEGLFPTVRHARTHLLAPGGTMIPERGTLFGRLVDSPVIAGLNRVEHAAGFDVRLLNSVATRGHFPVRLHTWPHRWLSPSIPLAGFDFAADPLEDAAVPVRVPVESAGEAHCLVAWFELGLGSGVAICNSPDNVASHWMQALIPLPEPVHVEPGELELTLRWADERLSLT